ncbi:MAG: hypothetical protein WC399_04460 [Bacilli bacterium]|jgi:hypothetical protein
MPEWIKILIGLGIVAFLVAAFIVSYKWNKKTPVPAGCETLLTDCEGCGITSCTLHKPSEDKVEVI